MKINDTNYIEKIDPSYTDEKDTDYRTGALIEHM